MTWICNFQRECVSLWWAWNLNCLSVNKNMNAKQAPDYFAASCISIRMNLNLLPRQCMCTCSSCLNVLSGCIVTYAKDCRSNKMRHIDNLVNQQHDRRFIPPPWHDTKHTWMLKRYCSTACYSNTCNDHQCLQVRCSKSVWKRCISKWAHAQPACNAVFRWSVGYHLATLESLVMITVFLISELNQCFKG